MPLLLRILSRVSRRSFAERKDAVHHTNAAAAAGLFLTLLTLSMGSPLRGGEPDCEHADTLIQQLGHTEFSRRVAAERALLEQGTAGLESVQAGLKSEDPEVRRRCHRLASTLQRVAFHERKEAIADDPWAFDEHLAPCWDFFHRLVGDTPQARALYIRMVEAETELMMGVVQHPQSWPIQFERRCADLRTFSERPHGRYDPAGTAALLLLSIHPDNQMGPWSSSTLTNMINDSAFTSSVERGQDRAVLRALLSHWVASSHSTPHMRLRIAERHDLEMGVAAAHEILQNRNGNGQSRSSLEGAIRFLTRHGGADVVDVLEELLEDETPLSKRRQYARKGDDHGSPRASVDLQVSDLALLGLIQLTEQDPAEYGFSNLRMEGRSQTGSFSSEADRKAALRKWHIWRSREGRHGTDEQFDASEGRAA